MATQLRIKRGTTNATAPTGLTAGEMAINLVDKKLYVGGTAGTNVIFLDSTSSVGLGTANTFTQLNTFSAGISASGATFSGSIQIPINTAPAITIGDNNTKNLTLGSIDGSGEIVQTGNSTATLNIRQESGGIVSIGDYNGTQNSNYIAVVDEGDLIQINGAEIQLNGIISSPLVLSSGLSAAGATFDGTVNIGTTALISAPSATALAIQSAVPAGTGVTPTVQIRCPSAATTLTSGTAAQNAFSTLGTISVQAATTYMFDGFYLIKTTGTTTHTISMSFALTTATITNCTWTTMSYPLASTPTSAVRAQDGNFFAGVTGGLVNSTNATAFNVVKFEGIMRVNAAGSVVPQITFSAPPGGTNTMEIGSYLRFYPIGSNTINAVGTAIG